MQETVEIPRPATLYRRIAASALRRRLSPKRRDPVLPDLTLSAEHPGISAATAAHYTRLMGGAAYDGRHRQSLASVLVHTAGFPLQMALMGRPDFPLPLLGLVHLRNRVQHRRPIPADVPLRITVQARDLAAHRKGTQVEVVVGITPVDASPAEGDAVSGAAHAEPAWTGVSTYLCRGLHLLDTEPGSAGLQGAKAGQSAGSCSHGGAGADPRLDLPPKTALWRFPVAAGREYAGVSGDYNPIHLSGTAAKAFGMPGAILHGMYAAAMALEGREPEGAGHSWEISFASPIVLPARVAFGVLREPGNEAAAAPETGQDAAADGEALRLAGWDPRTGREHFRGILSLPAS